MNFGTKFRINSKISYANALKLFNIDFNDFIKKQSYRFTMPLEALFE